MAEEDTEKTEDLMDFTSLVTEVSKQSGLTKAQVQLVLKELTVTVGGALKQGKAVRIARFGTLRQKTSASALQDKRIVFFAAKQLKELSS